MRLAEREKGVAGSPFRQRPFSPPISFPNGESKCTIRVSHLKGEVKLKMLSRDELIDSFDIDALPNWARSDEDVIRLAQVNLDDSQD